MVSDESIKKDFRQFLDTFDFSSLLSDKARYTDIPVNFKGKTCVVTYDNIKDKPIEMKYTVSVTKDGFPVFKIIKL